jgi:phosphoribosylamine--glycine ligase
MKILIIGSGGREHALAWKLAREGHRVFGAPGNPGIGQAGEIFNTTDYLGVAASVDPDVTVVGPEVPLVAGVVDQFRAAGRRIVGPSGANAQLEASKIYSKEFMLRTGIPTARFVRTETEEDGIAALDRFDFPIVVKADGLAAGKGVIIAQDRTEAVAAVRSLGPRLVIEEFLVGEEVSFIVLCDGREAVALEATQDHKAVGDGDTGPNTGGMGAYCDGRILSSAAAQAIMDRIVQPVIAATGFTGFLYAGLMMTATGPKVLEFNVRLGDPETQPLMHRLDCNFGDVLSGAASGDLRGAKLRWKSEPSVCVVIAADGYPAKARTGDLITGIEDCGAQVFHAGTRAGAHGLETAGGRVLGVTASGADLAAAIANTYAAVERIHFEGMHFRRDIGRKGLKRWNEAGGILDNMSSQITVFRSADESAGEDAAKVQEMLTDAGLRATLLDDSAPGVPSGAYEVRVDAEYQARAEQLIQEFSPDSELVEVDPSHDLDLVTVFRAAATANKIEAISIQNLLEAEGISAMVIEDSRLPYLGQEVRVAREHEAKARQLIEEALAAGSAGAEEAEQSAENG